MKIFFLGMEEELLIVRETTDGYHYSTHLKGKAPRRLAFDPTSDKRIYCATFRDGLWKSEDGGESWEKSGKGIESPKVTAVAVSPLKRVNENSVVYAGTEPSMLYYSEDKGRSWKEFTGIHTLPSKRTWSFPPRPHTHYIRWITPGYSNENYIGISIEAGAFVRTENYGKSWTDRPVESPVDTHTLLSHPK